MARRNRWVLVGLFGLLFLAVSQSLGASGIGAAAQPRPKTHPKSQQLTISLHGNRDSHSAPNAGPDIPTQSPDSVPDWLEPRGINIIDLVGQVPEGYLQGMILSWGSGSGIIVYEAGTRVGGTVEITTTIYPRVYTPDWPPHNLMTVFGCLGQVPIYDHMGSTVPESTLRVYDYSGQEVTSQIVSLDITITGLAQPIAGSLSTARYPVQGYGEGRVEPLPLGPDGLMIPPNSGCVIVQPGVDNYPLTGVFTISAPQAVNATVVGTQRHTFLSYIGVGYVGIFQPLMEQLRSTYPDRHGRIPLSAPPGSNYFLVRFPPLPGDPYTDLGDGIYDNADRLSSGSYRLSRGADLSADLVFSAAFPLSPAWQDADRAPGADFLPLLVAPVELAPPEYVLPAGMPYNDCFTQPDGCPLPVLEQIYNTQMVLDIIYLSVAPPPLPGEWVSLRMAGPAWFPLASGASALFTTSRAGPVVPPDAHQERQGSEAIDYVVYLPYVSHGLGPGDPLDCPCGLFDSLGRMLYYLPGP